MLVLVQSGIYLGGSLVLYVLLLPCLAVLLGMTAAGLLYELIQHLKGRGKPL